MNKLELIQALRDANGISIYLQVLKMSKNIEQDQKNKEIIICLELSKRYNEIYPLRNNLLRKDLSWVAFNKKYKDLPSKLESEEWKDLRDVAGFFELVGTFVKRKYVSTDVVFDFMFIQPQLWEKVSGLVKNMRKEYLKDLWIHWEYLVAKYYSYRK